MNFAATTYILILRTSVQIQADLFELIQRSVLFLVLLTRPATLG